MKTVRYRRSRPGALAVALALMLTMLFVCAAANGGRARKESAQTAAETSASAEIRMEGLRCFFLIEDSFADPQEARIAAALCAENGGAGMIRESGGEYLVVREAVSAESEDRAEEASAEGLTLRIEGSAREIAALSKAADFLYAQARETGSLASMSESGTAETSTILTLLSLYRTQARELLRDLNGMTEEHAVLLTNAVQSCAERLEDAISAPDTGKFRLIHAAACADWISLLETMRSSV